MSIADIANTAATAVATYIGTKNATEVVVAKEVEVVANNTKKILLFTGCLILVLTIIFFSIRKK